MGIGGNVKAVLTAKILIDFVAAVAFAYRRNWPMAVMFAGFAAADAGALMMADRP